MIGRILRSIFGDGRDSVRTEYPLRVASTVDDAVETRGEFVVREVETIRVRETARRRFDAEYPELSRPERESAARQTLSASIQRVENVTCVGLHEDIVDAIDPGQRVSLGADDLALGDDDSTSPSSSDTSLNNQIGRTDVTTADDEGSNLFLSTFIDSSELNGYTFREVGIYSESGTLWNHALLANPVEKTSTKTVTIDVSLAFS